MDAFVLSSVFYLRLLSKISHRNFPLWQLSCDHRNMGIVYLNKVPFPGIILKVLTHKPTSFSKNQNYITSRFEGYTEAKEDALRTTRGHSPNCMYVQFGNLATRSHMHHSVKIVSGWWWSYSRSVGVLRYRLHIHLCVMFSSVIRQLTFSPPSRPKPCFRERMWAFLEIYVTLRQILAKVVYRLTRFIVKNVKISTPKKHY